MLVIKFVFLLCCLFIERIIAHDSDAIYFPENDQNNKVSPSKNFNYHHHHHLGRQFEDNSDKIIGDDQIPLSFIQRLNEIDNLNDLEKYLDNQEMLTDVGGLANRFGGVERTAAIVPKVARCIPTLQTVELKSSNDSSLFYFPSCTRVERCGGCCSHNLLSCQPTQTETLAFQVVVSQYSGGNKLSVKRKEIILVEKHTKCKCDCTIKKEDCNVFQEYREDECRCTCTNVDEKRKCDKYNNTKLWDPKVCRCRCRNYDDCTTAVLVIKIKYTIIVDCYGKIIRNAISASGSTFDPNKCACVPIPMRRRFAELGINKERNFKDNEKYDIENLNVSPIEETNNKEKIVPI